MKRKGFTLIEIIICIVLIAIIGTASFIGIKTMKNNIRINKLEQITDKSLLAAQLYIENNKDAYNQLHKEKNGVVIPIKLLVNEGLLSLENTDLTDSDIENEYVISALSSTTPGSTDCTEINETTSWSSDAPIYLCINSATGSTNLSIIDPTTTANSIKIKEPYYFKGYGTKNWIKYNSTKYRILSIESDDSLILYHSDSFGTTFNNLTQPVSTISSSCLYTCPIANESPNLKSNKSYYYFGDLFERTPSEINGESSIDCNDVAKTSLCSISSNCGRNEACAINGWMAASVAWEHYGGASTSQYNLSEIQLPTNARKIHLKSCMKITGGSGDYGSPYILENKCS